MAKKIDLNGLDHFKGKENAMIASEYSSSKTYSVGDYCYHAGTLYCCTTAITTAENWTAGHWTAAKLADDTSALKTAIGQNALALSYTDVRAGYPVNTYGEDLTIASSTKTTTIVKIASVEKGKKYKITVEYNSPSATSSRDSVIVDSDDKVRQSFSLTFPNTSPRIATNEFIAKIDGYICLAVDNNYTNISIIGEYVISKIQADLSSLYDDFGIRNFYPENTKLEPVAGSTSATCIGIEFNNGIYTLNGTNTKTQNDTYLRIVLSYSLYRAANGNTVLSNSNPSIKLIKNHQYMLRFDTVGGTMTGARLAIILRNSQNSDLVTVYSRDGNTVSTLACSETTEAYLLLYSQGDNTQSFSNYQFKVYVVDMAESLYGLNEKNSYKVAVKFIREQIFASSEQSISGAAQGFCTDGTYLYLATITGTPETGSITKIDTSGNIIAQNTIGQIGHMNQLAYDLDNECILCVGSANPYIWKIDPSTLELIERVEYQAINTALSDRCVDYTGFWALAFDADKNIWVVGDNHCYAIVSRDFTKIIRVCINETAGQGQGLYPFGDLLYASFAGTGSTHDFFAYDWEGHTVFKFNKWDSTVNEFEGVCSINGQLYSYWNQGSSTYKVMRDTVELYKYIPVDEVKKKFSYLA